MLPISAIVGVSTVGYLLDQLFRENEFNEYNEYNKVPIENINGCAEQYPWNFVESFEDTTINNNQEPSPLNIKKINGPTNITALNNAGNPKPEYLINATERPVEDFLVNNMVPFFKGSGTNQNMTGTSVQQGNINSDNFNLGNDNKTPYNTLLSTFTGCDSTYMHKREVTSLFSPLEQRDKFTVPGEDISAQRPLRDRYTTSILHKNDQKPFESQIVGPGINVAADLPNSGQGFNAGISTQVKPNNVNAYKLSQLPGRVAGTKYQASNLPEALPGTGPSFNSYVNSKTNNYAWDKNPNDNNNNSINSEKLIEEEVTMYGVPNKKEPILITPDRRPSVATPAVTQAPSHYSNYVLPSNTNRRSVTNVSFGQSIELK